MSPIDIVLSESLISDVLEEILTESEETSLWTVSPINSEGLCPLIKQGVPNPPFFNITRVWVNTTGLWVGIRFFRAGVANCEADILKKAYSCRDTLTVKGISLVSMNHTSEGGVGRD
jgi:hypothetical protein